MILTLPLSYPGPPPLVGLPRYRVWIKDTGTDLLGAQVVSVKGTEVVTGGVGSAVVTVDDYSPGTVELFDDDGFPLKGPFSPTIIVERDGVRIHEGYVSRLEGDPLAKRSTLTLRDSTGHLGHSVVGTIGRSNMLPDISAWSDINVDTSSGPSADERSGVTLTPGDEPDNPWRFKYARVLFAPSDAPRQVFVAAWGYLPSASLTPPKRGLQVTVYDRATGTMLVPSPSGPVEVDGHVISTQFADLAEKMPRDKHTRLGPITADIPPGGDYDVRCLVWASRDPDSPISYSDPWMVVDEGVRVGPGSTSAELAGVVLAYGMTWSFVGGSVLVLSSSTLVYEDGMSLPAREHANVLAVASGPELEMRWNPQTRDLIVGGARTTGNTRTDIEFGTGGRAGHLTKWASDDDGMETVSIVTAPESDPAREERFADLGGAHPWYGVHQAPGGTLPKELGAIATQYATTGSDLTVVDGEVAMTVPPDGRTPGDWLSWRGSNPPLGLCDLVPARVQQGHGDMSKEWRITSWELRPQEGDSFKVTVD